MEITSLFFILPELSRFIDNKNRFYHYFELCLCFCLDCFNRFSPFPKSPLLIFVPLPKHFSPRMSEESASLQFLLSRDIFLSSERTRTGPTTTRASNRGQPSIFSHGVIALPSLVCFSVAAFARSALLLALTSKASAETSRDQLRARITPHCTPRDPPCLFRCLLAILKGRPLSTRMALVRSGTFRISSVPAAFWFNEKAVYICEPAGGGTKRTHAVKLHILQTGRRKRAIILTAEALLKVSVS